jgi:hypothetical protein
VSQPIVHQEVIKAPIQKVWEAITGFDDYGKWNEFCPQVESDFREGGHLVMHAHFGGKHPVVQKEYFRIIKAPFELRYGLNWSFLLYSERTQRLFELPNGHTQYHSSLRITGLLAPIALLSYRDGINRGFALSIRGLKRYLE